MSSNLLYLRHGIQAGPGQPGSDTACAEQPVPFRVLRDDRIKGAERWVP